mmetsp:Transcript_92048/g.213934  ORF Transcript_92048/g.213934 Transcript_92048/m.213934 type:complete len:424 (-) Transcript_92048:27-1298(-)
MEHRGVAPRGPASHDTQDVASLKGHIEQLQAELASARSDLELAALKEEELETRYAHAQETISKLRAQQMRTNSDLQESERAQHEHVAAPKKRVSLMEGEASDSHQESLERKELPSTQLGDSEEMPLLSAAYQQISVLNTQLAHLYTELTMARTEVQNLRAEQAMRAPNEQAAQVDSAADVQKQTQQIADLLSDIKHLQLDLEYHQQKLDQMIEEKQRMTKELKKAQHELLEAKQQVEERDQMLKHREVDLAYLKEELKRPGSSGGGEDDAGALAALRSEAAAKDSALIVSHYELHKEKLMRDRLEQKNLKLMERMQKLMLVVETLRKDNVNLERSLTSKDKVCEERTTQLAQVNQKARQLQKLVKGSKSGSLRAQKSTTLELGAPASQGLPSLQAQRAIDSARGSRVSTPRTPRTQITPYSAR